jgi:hypothetical protein
LTTAIDHRELTTDKASNVLHLAPEHTKEAKMRTDLIRTQLDVAWKEEARTGEFAKLIREQLLHAGASSVPEDSQTVRDILQGWRLQLDNVPALIDALREAAWSAGVAGAVEPVLWAAEEYFVDEDDVLPDRYGILGLLDDVYLALSLIHGVCEQHRRRTGHALMGVDLDESIASVRLLFRGARLAALDERIRCTLSRPDVARAVEQLDAAGSKLRSVLRQSKARG